MGTRVPGEGLPSGALSPPANDWREAALGWRRRLRETVDPSGLAASDGFAMAGGLEDDWGRAQGIKAHLMERAHNKTLDDFYAVSTTDTPEGPCPTIVTHVRDGSLQLMDRDVVRRRLEHQLELVGGIGPYRARVHRAAGRHSVRDLVRVPPYRSEAERVLQLLDTPAHAFRRVRERHGPSHPAVLWTTALFQAGDLLFLDIETLGLGGEAIILAGLLAAGRDGLSLTQYVATSADQEPALLAAVALQASRHAVLVTYNGRSFDAPMLARRQAYYGLVGLPNLSGADWPHYDLLHFARRAWQDALPNLAAATVERVILGIERTDDLPGSFVPEFYEAYRRAGNVGPLSYIIEHNRMDLTGLVQIFERLVAEWAPYADG